MTKCPFTSKRFCLLTVAWIFRIQNKQKNLVVLSILHVSRLKLHMLGNLSCVQNFRISKMKRDFQNIDGKFKSLGDYFNVLFVFMPHFITGNFGLQIILITSDSKKRWQSTVVIQFCGLSPFFWIRVYILPCLMTFFSKYKVA